MERDKGPRIHASVANRLIRGFKGSREEILAQASEIVSGLSDDEVMGIHEGKFKLEGISPGPLTLVENKP